MQRGQAAGCRQQGQQCVLLLPPHPQVLASTWHQQVQRSALLLPLHQATPLQFRLQGQRSELRELVQQAEPPQQHHLLQQHPQGVPDGGACRLGCQGGLAVAA